MKRCALYHRVSTIDQRPELARRELRASAVQRGYRVVLDVEEKGTGATNDRPGLTRVLDAARRGELDAVIVWKLDRLSRAGVIDTLRIVRELDSAGVRFIATTQGIETGADTPLGSLLITILAAVAELERATISERTRIGMAGARRRGSLIGRPGRVELPEPLTVQRMRNAGASWSTIAHSMNVTAKGARDAGAICFGCGASPARWIECRNAPECRVLVCHNCRNHRGGAPALDCATIRELDA